MRLTHALAMLALLAAAGCGDDKTGPDAEVDPAEAALAQIDDLKPPQPDVTRAADEEYVANYRSEFADHWLEKGVLIEQFYADYPNHSRTAVLIDQYWASFMKPDLSMEETADIIERLKTAGEASTNPDVARHAGYWTAVYSTYRDQDSPATAIRHAMAFANEYGYDLRGARLFMLVALSENADPETLTIAYSAVASLYPNSREGQFAAAMVPLVQFIGQPFEMEFDDAITGKKVNMATLRGKVVVVDFWATWCQPCIDAIPLMKQVYEERKGEGLEYVGVNMDGPDTGGQQSMNAFVEQFEIDWPQYYVGESREFPDRYGVHRLPTVFILDKKGVIRSIDGVNPPVRTVEKLLAE